MPSVLTHAISGLALGYILAPRKPPARYYLACALLPVLPDADVVGFAAGVPYEHVLGHRGISHSLASAAILGAVTGAIVARGTRAMAWKLAFIFSLVTASHGLLDALTDGGLGIAFFAPFNNHRYFFPFRPMQVSPIGLREFFSDGGLRVIASEALWVWLPCFGFVAIVLWRKRHANQARISL
jgi:inner membrane protein